MQVSCCWKVPDRTKVSTKVEPYTQLYSLHSATCLLLALYNLSHQLPSMTYQHMHISHWNRTNSRDRVRHCVRTRPKDGYPITAEVACGCTNTTADAPSWIADWQVRYVVRETIVLHARSCGMECRTSSTPEHFWAIVCPVYVVCDDHSPWISLCITIQYRALFMCSLYANQDRKSRRHWTIVGVTLHWGSR